MGSVAYCDGFIYYIVQSFDSGEQNDVLKLYSMKEDGTEKKELHTFQYGRVYPNAAAFYQRQDLLSVQTLKILKMEVAAIQPSHRLSCMI